MRGGKLWLNIYVGIENIVLHKLRSFLTVLGIVFGVASVIAMLSVGEGASRAAMDQIRRLGSRNVLVTAVKPVDQIGGGGKSQGRMSIYGLLYEDAARIRESCRTVRSVVPVKLLRQHATVGDRELDIRLVGTTPDWFRLVQRQFVAGRAITPRDALLRNAVAVLTEQGARRLFAAGAAVGTIVRIGGNAFEVVGILRSESGIAGTIQTPDSDVDAYIPIETARERFGDTIVLETTGSRLRELVELHQVILEIDAIEHVEATAAAVEAALSRFHPKKDYLVSVPLTLLRQAEQTKRTFNVVLGSIACISLIVGGIGIMNIMLASVTERTREIGIRRAIGARRRQIVSQFLIETMVLAAVGGLAGVALGMLIPAVIARATGMATVVTLWSVLLSFGISVGVGILFGIYPAFRAANLDPIVALRHE